MKTFIAGFIQIMFLWNKVEVLGEKGTNTDLIPRNDISNKINDPRILDILAGIYFPRNFPLYTSQIYFTGPNWESLLRWHSSEYSSTVEPTENISNEKDQYDDINPEIEDKSESYTESDSYELQTLDNIDFNDTMAIDISQPLSTSDRLTRNTKSKNISKNIGESNNTTTMSENEDDYMDSTDESETDEKTSFKPDGFTNIAVQQNKSSTTTIKPPPMPSYGPPPAYQQTPSDLNKTDSEHINSTTGLSNIATPNPTLSSYGPPASGSSYYSHWSSHYPDSMYSVPPTSHILHGVYGPSRTPGVDHISFTTETPMSSFKPSFPDYFRNYRRPVYADLFLPMVYRSEIDGHN